MPLSMRDIQKMLAVVRATETIEIDCDACLMHIGEFAELHLLGRPVPDALKAVEQHLLICDECQEEYEILVRALLELAKVPH